MIANFILIIQSKNRINLNKETFVIFVYNFLQIELLEN